MLTTEISGGSLGDGEQERLKDNLTTAFSAS